jgi:hypothetical protein
MFVRTSILPILGRQAVFLALLAIASANMAWAQDKKTTTSTSQISWSLAGSDPVSDISEAPVSALRLGERARYRQLPALTLGGVPFTLPSTADFSWRVQDLSYGFETPSDRYQVNLQKSYVANWTLGGLDVGITPRASMVSGPGGSATRLGALVAIGENLQTPRTQTGNWYVFVGGGAEALTYEPGSRRSLVDGLRVEEKVMIGDGQAGLAFRVGAANLSLAYVRRETNARSRVSQLNSYDVEDFAALTFSIGR